MSTSWRVERASFGREAADHERQSRERSTCLTWRVCICISRQKWEVAWLAFGVSGFICESLTSIAECADSTPSKFTERKSGLQKKNEVWKKILPSITSYHPALQNPLQLHTDLSVYFRNRHNRWILYPEGSIYSSRLPLREWSFWLGSKKVRFYGGRLRSEFKGIEQWLN